MIHFTKSLLTAGDNLLSKKRESRPSFSLTTFHKRKHYVKILLIKESMQDLSRARPMPELELLSSRTSRAVSFLCWSTAVSVNLRWSMYQWINPPPLFFWQLFWLKALIYLAWIVSCLPEKPTQSHYSNKCWAEDRVSMRKSKIVWWLISKNFERLFDGMMSNQDEPDEADSSKKTVVNKTNRKKK